MAVNYGRIEALHGISLNVEEGELVTLIGVLDLDSPLLARFDARDQAGCEALVAVILRHLGPHLPV